MQGCCRRWCVAQNFFSASIFQLSGWALVAPSCFALQVPDVKGLQDLMCFRFLVKFNVNILDRGLVPKPFGFSQELQWLVSN